MLKQLVIPFFVLSLAAVGCGSSSSGTPDGSAGHVGTAGTSGTAGTGSDAGAGTTGTAGATAGTTGTAGATAGTTGTAGTGVDASTDSATDSASDAPKDTTSPIDTSGDTSSLAACTTGKATDPAMSAADFCANLIAKCGNVQSGGSGIPTPYTQAMCEATYTARTTTQKTCQSYHLCWGVEGVMNQDAPSPTTHCQHAWAAAVCN